jgi:uncharacterized membrane protein
VHTLILCGKERGQKERNGVLWFNDHDLFVDIRNEYSKDVNSIRNPCYVYNNVFLMFNPLVPILTA